MARQRITISNIYGGVSPAFYHSAPGQYLESIAIDPDAPKSDASTEIKSGGVIRPVAYEKFSGANVNDEPVAIITTPKDSNVYTVLRNGRLISYNSSLGSETLIGTVTGGNAEGAAYYNNYIYIFGTGASNDDVSRYGPLNNSPSLTNGVWKTTFSLTALTDTTYPSTRHSFTYNNHWAFAHTDNKLYFCDVSNGQGIINYIKTTRTTDEGDTNDGSTYNALDLPFGYFPYAIGSKGTTLVIVASPTTDTNLIQGESLMFFWDTVSSSFSGQPVRIPDPICTGIKNINGELYGLSGTVQGGTRLWKYVGGETVQTLAYLEEPHPPLQGAIASYANRLYWGGFTTSPANSASIYAYGTKSDLFPRGVHNIARSTVTATSSNGLITALGAVEQSSSVFPKLVIAGTDGTNYNIDKQSTTYQTSVFRSEVFNIGQKFQVVDIRIPFAQAIAANMTIVPKLFFDDASASQAGTTINSTNYASSERSVNMTTINFSGNTTGENNFFLELTFSGTALAVVTLPIIIDIEVATPTLE